METSGKIKNDNMSDQDFYKFQFAEPTRRLPQPSTFPAGWGHPTLRLIVKMCPRGGHTKSKLLILNSTLQLRLPH